MKNAEYQFSPESAEDYVYAKADQGKYEVEPDKSLQEFSLLSKNKSESGDISLEYGSGDFQIRILLRPLAQSHLFDSVKKAYGSSAPAETSFEVDSFIVRQKNGALNLSKRDILPDNWGLVYYPVPENTKGANLTDKEFDDERILVMRHQLWTPAGILGLLHETGHINEMQEMSEEDGGELARILERADSEPINAIDLAVALKNERNAWKFALSKIRGFIGREDQGNGIFSRELALKFIHNYALRSYGQDFVNIIEEDWFVKDEEEE